MDIGVQKGKLGWQVRLQAAFQRAHSSHPMKRPQESPDALPDHVACLLQLSKVHQAPDQTGNSGLAVDALAGKICRVKRWRPCPIGCLPGAVAVLGGLPDIWAARGSSSACQLADSRQVQLHQGQTAGVGARKVRRLEAGGHEHERVQQEEKSVVGQKGNSDEGTLPGRVCAVGQHQDDAVVAALVLRDAVVAVDSCQDGGDRAANTVVDYGYGIWGDSSRGAGKFQERGGLLLEAELSRAAESNAMHEVTGVLDACPQAGAGLEGQGHAQGTVRGRAWQKWDAAALEAVTALF
jgi:hypothetical protein